MFYRILVVLIIFATSCQFKSGTKGLVSVNHIAERLENGDDLQIVDLRIEDEYVHSHIPGAKRIWRRDIENPDHEHRGMRIEKRELADFLGKLGLSNNDSIFIYDAKGNVDAARLWWLLNLYGFEKVALIDGGFVQWRMQGYEIEEGYPDWQRKKFEFEGPDNSSLLVTKEQVSKKEYEQLIDMRSDDEYNGLIMKNGAIRPGHIPGAIQMDYMKLISGGSFKLKSKEEILKIMSDSGLDQDKRTVTYCHSGVRSALGVFALKNIVGMKSVSNYDGSWIEWSDDESLPTE